MNSANENKIIVQDFEIDVVAQTMTSIVDGSSLTYDYKWLADGGIVAYEYLGNGTNAANIYFAGPSSHLVLEIKRLVFEKEVLSEQNEQGQKEEAE
jgi:hypothetical protein